MEEHDGMMRQIEQFAFATLTHQALSAETAADTIRRDQSI
jgi:hypothetical protein